VCIYFVYSKNAKEIESKVKTIFTYLSLTLLFLCSVNNLHAQAPQVNITPNGNLTVCDGSVVNVAANVTNPFASTSNYEISNIPFAPYNTNFGTAIHLVDDAVSTPLPIGFSFCFFGNTYTQFYLGSNGWIGFSPGQTMAFTAATIPSTSWLVPRNCIMGPWMDWNPGVGTNIGNYIRYQTQGIAPYRRLVVTWTNTPLYQCTAINGTIQIVIYESTNVIENHITAKPVCLAWAGGTATQGLHNLAGTVAVVVPGRNASVWTANNESRRFTPNGPPNFTVTWLANGIPVGTGNNISHTVFGNTQLIARVNFNCSNLVVYDTLNITTGGSVNANFIVSNPATGNACAGQPVTFTYTGGAPASATFNWTFPGGIPALATGIGPHTITYASAGNYTPTLTVTQPSCGTGSFNLPITIGAPVTSTFNVTSPVCIGQNSTITYTGNAPIGATYNWNFNGGTIVSGSGQGPYQVNWATAGNKTITLTVTNGGCTSAASTQTVNVNPLPTSTFTASTPICTNANSTITYTGNAPAGATYTWNFNGGTIVSGAGQGPYQINWTTPGTKNITLTVTNGGCTSVLTTQNVVVNLMPTSTFTASNPLCIGQNGTITYTGNAPAGATYNWNFNGGTIVSGAGQGPYQVNWATAGVKTITLTVNNGGCISAVTSQNVNIQNTPSSTFTVTSPICQNVNSTITYTGNAPAGATYNWNFNGGTIVSGSGQGPYQINWATAGTKTITLTVTQGSCTSSITSQNVVVNPLPSAAFNATASVGINAPATVTYTGGAGGTAVYTWNFNGGTIISGTGAGPYQISWPTVGIKTISLTVTLNGCTATFTQNVNVVNGPSSAFTALSPICIGQNSLITYTGGAAAGASYTWNFGGGTVVSGTGQGPYQINWATPGNKTITLIVVEGGIPSATTTQTVVVNPIPTSTFTAPASVCVAANATITYTGNAPAGATYNWNFNGGTIVSGTGQGPYQINWNTPGNKTVTLSVTQNGCVSTVQNTVVNIIALPNASFSATSPVCAGFVSTITYNGGAAPGSTYNWNFNGGNIVSGTGAGPYLVSWPTTGIKNISLTVTQNGCISLPVTQQVEVINTPVANFNINPNVICQGVNATVTFSGTAPAGATYNWNFGDATVISGNGVGPYQIVYNTSGAKTIFLSVSANGCTSPSVSQSFNVTPAPTPAFNIANQICQGANATLTFTGTASFGAIFNWNFGGATVVSGTGAGPYLLNFPSSGNFDITLNLSEGSCAAPAYTQTVTVIPPPTAIFDMPILGCADELVTITYTGNASNSATFYWDFDGATIISGSGPGPIEIVWNNPGNQAVSLYVVENGCTSPVFTQNITINQIPLFEIIAPALAVSGQTVNINYGGIPAMNGSYTWNFENGNPATGSGLGPFDVIWNDGGDHTVSLTLDVPGCASLTVSTPVTILSAADVSFAMEDEVCENEVVTITYTGTADPSAIFSWNFDGGIIISGSGSGPFQILWETEGIKNVSCQVTQFGITSPIVVNSVTVNPIPTASFSASGGLCSGQMINLNYNGNASINANFSWDIGVGQMINNNSGSVQILFPSQGNYPVSLNVEENGCISLPFTANLAVLPTPTADFEIDTLLCENTSTIVVFAGSGSSNAFYDWNFDGATVLSGSGQGSYVIEWSNSGIYQVSLVVNQHSCISDTFSVNVQVSTNPVASFTMPASICQGEEFDLVFNGQANPGAQFNWNFNNLSVVSGTDSGPFVLTADNPGNYNINLFIADEHCSSNAAQQSITVNPYPISTINYAGPTFVGVPTTINYTGTSPSNANFTWNYPNATLISGNANSNIVLSYASVGLYPVLLGIELNGCIDISDTLWVEVLPTPNASIQGGIEICSNNNISLNYVGNATPNASYFWDFDGGIIASGNGAGPYEISWNTSGNKTVSVYIIENGIQSNIASHLVQVNLSPSADFTMNEDACMFQNVSIQYMGTGGLNAIYNWDFDGATVISGANQGPFIIQFENSGIHNVTLQVTQNGCTSTIFSKAIDIHYAPTADFIVPEQTCKGAGVQLVYSGNASNNATFVWTVNGEEITVNPGQNNPIVQWDAIGNQNISLVVYDQGCPSSSQTHDVMVRALPPANAGADIQFCTGVETQLAATPDSGMTYQWSPSTYLANINDPQTAINYVAPHQNLTEIEYVLSVFDGLCTGYDTVKVTAVPTPVASFDAPLARCMNDQEINFTAGGMHLPQASYLWNFGPNVLSHNPTQKNPTGISFTAPGTHAISLLVSQLGCVSDVYTDSITIHDIPLARFTEQNAKGCEPLNVTFIGEETEDGLQYHWNFGNGSSAQNRETSHIYYEPGTMNVSLTVTDSNGCSHTELKNNLITVFPKPQADFRLNTSYVFIGEEVSIVNLSEGGNNCMYIINMVDTVYTCNTFYTFPQIGENYVELQVSNTFGCVDTVIRSLTVDYGSDYFIPAAFTPNFDNLNDEFKLVAPDAKNFTMTVFDRWGQEIFRTNDINKGWDGKIKNSVLPAPLGTYTYLMTFITKNNVPREVRGTVTLLR